MLRSRSRFNWTYQVAERGLKLPQKDWIDGLWYRLHENSQRRYGDEKPDIELIFWKAGERSEVKLIPCDTTTLCCDDWYKPVENSQNVLLSCYETGFTHFIEWEKQLLSRVFHSILLEYRILYSPAEQAGHHTPWSLWKLSIWLAFENLMSIIFFKEHKRTFMLLIMQGSTIK